MDAPELPPDSSRNAFNVNERASRLSLASFLPPIGSTIKHYEIIRLLGKGGMGVVYLARDTRLGRLVALKLLFGYAAESAERTLAEARATASCKHENIVIIYDVDTYEGFPYLVLEYIEGITLRKWMDQRQEDPTTRAEMLSIGACLELILPVVRALSCAHDNGIIHRDLKPDNILLAANGPVKVVDFGIAQRTRSDDPRAEPIRAGDGVDSMSGTLAYMAPECWLSQPIDAAVDIWAIGIILYELMVGAHPLTPPTPAKLGIVANLDVKMPSARQARPDIEPLAAIVDRCLEKPKERRIQSARELYVELEMLSGRSAIVAAKGLRTSNPFAGLLAFQEADEAFFFGREHEIAGVLARLRFQPLVTLAGPSGAGKSSFVRAGILPAWKRQSEQHFSFILRPGSHPIASLYNLLVDAISAVREHDRPSLSIALESEADIMQKLRAEPGFWATTLRAVCRAMGKRTRLLLFVDQFEEIFTLVEADEDRNAFLATLIGAADDASSPLRIILATRSDFLDRMADVPKLMADVVRGLVFLSSMGETELREALTKPVEALGFRFESAALVDKILEALGRTASPLPLLQFTAAQLWEARDVSRRLLTEASYEALGGVEGTLASHADSVLASMSAHDQPLVRAFFERLVTPERTRAIVAFAELAELAANRADAERVLGRLVEARLLVVETEPLQQGPMVEIVHESLIARWPMLSRWLSEHEEDAVFLDRLRTAAKEWRAREKPRGLLWRDEAMTEAMRWRERSRIALPPAEAEYLDAVLALAHATKQARRMIVVALFSTTVAVAITMGYLARQERLASETAQQNEARSQVLAEQARRDAVRARDAARLAIAHDLAEDPTSALALLREVEAKQAAPSWSTLAMKALRRPTSLAMIRGLSGMVWTAELSRDGEHLLTSSAEIAQIWETYSNAPPIVLRGHHGPVWLATYSPDEQHVLTASWDGTARIFGADGQAEPVILAHPDRVSWAEWSPDGKRVATTCWDKAIRVWDIETRTPIVLQGHQERARRVRFSASGKRIVSAGYDNTARVWNADGTGDSVVLSGHAERLVDAVFSPDESHVATASIDNTALVHSIDPRAIATKPVALVGHTERLNSIAFSPDGKLIATASDDATTRIWRSDGSGDPIVLRCDKQVRFATFSPDGRYVLMGSVDKTARLWSVSELDTMTTLEGHDGTVEGGTFRSDSKQIVTSAEDGTVRVWSTQQKNAPVVFPGPQGVFPSLSVHPSSKQIAITWEGQTTANLWNVDGRGTPIRLMQGDVRLRAVHYDPRGDLVAIAGTDGTVRISRLDGSSEPIVLDGAHESAETLAFSPAHTKLRLAASGSDGKIRVWTSPFTEPPLELKGATRRLVRIQWSPDGARLLSVMYDDPVARVYSLESPTTPIVLRNHSNVVHWAEWSPDGKQVVTASADNSMRIVRVDDLTAPPIVLQAHTHEVTRASFSPDGKSIASVSMDGTCRVWPADGTEPSLLVGKDVDGLHLLSWSPDGKRIAAASERTLHIWNADGSGIPLLLVGHTARMHVLTFSPDGLWLATCAVDGTVRVWPNVADVPSLARLDDELWHASSYCMAHDLRRELLGFSDSMAQMGEKRCRDRVLGALQRGAFR